MRDEKQQFRLLTIEGMTELLEIMESDLMNKDENNDFSNLADDKTRYTNVNKVNNKGK